MGLNATPCMHDVDVCYCMVLSLFSDVFIRVPRAKLEARTSVNLEPWPLRTARVVFVPIWNDIHVPPWTHLVFTCRFKKISSCA